MKREWAQLNAKGCHQVDSTASTSPPAQNPTDKRHAKNMCCPIPGCRALHYHMSKDTLLRHLCRHAQAGEAIPQSALTHVNHSICINCRHLVKVGKTCAFCATKRQQTANTAPEGGQQLATSSTNNPYDSAQNANASVSSSSSSTSRTPLSAQCPQLTPIIEQILLAQLPTIRHVPANCDISSPLLWVTA